MRLSSMMMERKSSEDGEIKKTGENTYEGISDDIIGVALGESSGNALNWHYTLKLKYGDG